VWTVEELADDRLVVSIMSASALIGSIHNFSFLVFQTFYCAAHSDADSL
jgi:hypothetical protein